ncbi:MAG: phosphatase PAP2 family protein [Pseudomonadota bacterium]
MEAGSLALRNVRLREALRWAAPAVYLAALSVAMWRDGIPAARERLLLWIVLGLLAFSITNVRGWARGVVLEWIPFALILSAYDLLRGQADGLLFATHVRPQLEADRVLGLGTAPTVWLQEHLWHGPADLRWWDYGAWAVYSSYFLATYLLAAALWFVARDRFRPYVATVSLLALMGFATYALFPAAPPWLASEEGALEWTTRTIGIVSGHVPVLDFATLFERGSQYANPVAAVPSLHAAYTLLLTLTLWPLVPRWARPVLAAYPLAMAFALVYTAEHYLVDVLLGWAYAIVAVWVVRTVGARLARRARPAASA